MHGQCTGIICYLGCALLEADTGVLVLHVLHIVPSGVGEIYL